MDFKNIKLIPGTNAVGQVYAEKTGNAYLGYVMSGAGIAAGGHNPLEYVKMHYDNEGTWYVYTEAAEWFGEEYAEEIAAYKTTFCGTIYDGAGNVIYTDEHSDRYSLNAPGQLSSGMDYSSETLPAQSGTYEIQVYTDYMDAEATVLTATGTWTIDE